jgi:hypothetical protein
VCRVVDFKGEIAFDASKPDSAPRKWFDSNRMNDLGWHPPLSWRQAWAKPTQSLCRAWHYKFLQDTDRKYAEAVMYRPLILAKLRRKKYALQRREPRGLPAHPGAGEALPRQVCMLSFSYLKRLCKVM